MLRVGKKEEGESRYGRQGGREASEEEEDKRAREVRYTYVAEAGVCMQSNHGPNHAMHITYTWCYLNALLLLKRTVCLVFSMLA